jgi:hypothetical protein
VPQTSSDQSFKFLAEFVTSRGPSVCVVPDHDVWQLECSLSRIKTRDDDWAWGSLSRLLNEERERKALMGARVIFRRLGPQFDNCRIHPTCFSRAYRINPS